MSRNDPSARPASIQGLPGSNSSVRSLAPIHTSPRSSIPTAWQQTNTTTSDHRSLRSSRSRTSTLRHSRSGTNSLGSSAGLRLVTDSPRSSEKELAPAAGPSDPYADFDPSNPRGDSEDDDEFPQLSNENLNVFVDRFRSAVNQFARETEAGVDVDSPERNNDLYTSSAASSSLSPYSSGSYTSHGGAYSPYATIGYSGYRDPAPSDEHVRVLGGFVRRMPTIESLGSREMGSSVHHEDNNNNNNNNNNGPVSPSTPSRQSSIAASLSPTRMNTVSSVSSPSRSNSVQTNVSHQLTTVNENRLTLSEMGELGRERIGTGDTGSTDGAISVFHTAPNSPSQLAFPNQDLQS
jgi:hypothetical protein